jgi:D-alanine-D-alanine ligase
MDKIAMKQAFAAAGLTTARWLAFRDGHPRPAFVDRVEAELGIPCFVKPANMGSSIGVSKAHDRAELDAAIELATRFDEWVIAEEAIVGREIEVGILGDDPPEASTPGEVIPGAEFYTYADKYEDDAVQLLTPAPITPAQVAEVQGLAVRAFEACRGEAMARVDCFLSADLGFLVNEVNTIPGFTPASQYPRMWAESGVSYPELLDRLIALARARHERRSRRAGRQREVRT